MHKKIFPLLVFFLAVNLLAPAPALAQSEGTQPNFVLLQAFAIPTASSTISVFFGNKFPLDPGAPRNIKTPYTATDGPFVPSKWIVRAINLKTRKFDKSQSLISSVTVLTFGRQVELNMVNPVDTNTFNYIIIYAEANTPMVTLTARTPPDPQKTFTAAKGKNDADIYFSGEATAARGNKPSYSIESKFSYLSRMIRATEFDAQNNPLKFKDYGALGFTATFNSGANSTIDPDSITVAGTYQRTFLFGPSPTGIRLNSNFIGFELDKDNQTRNLMSEVDGTLVLPSKRLNRSEEHPAFATMDFLLGIEGGHNYKNELQPDGLGNFWRPKFGAGAYLLILKPGIFDRITFNAEYKVRLPRSAEIFTETVNGSKMTFLTKKPRHYVATDLDLMFAPSYGLALKYRYGSLPPAFNLVDHKVSLGFVLQLLQTNK